MSSTNDDATRPAPRRHHLRPGERLDWDDPEWGGRVHVASAGIADAEGSDEQ